jgi:hypothetical protein
MVISFGASWPLSIAKSYKSRTAKGKSLPFLLLITFGYLCGLIWKALDWMDTGVFAYPSVFYVLNVLMVSIDIGLYFRNSKLDKINEGK